MKKLLPFLGIATVTLSVLFPDLAHAGWLDLFPNPPGNGGAPEIDPSAFGSALALVMGGVAMLADRFRR